MTDTIEIIHVSDVHRGNRRPTWVQRSIRMRRGEDDVADALGDAVKALVSRANVTTVGVLSGDLSVLGDVSDIGAVRYWWTTVASTPPGTQLTCDGTMTTRPVYILGNHDFWNGSVRKTGLRHSRVHDEVRGAYWEHNRVWSIVSGRLRIDMYELDTTPSRGLTGLVTNVLASGELDPTVPKELVDVINRQPVEAGEVRVRVIVMHHPVGELSRYLQAISKLARTGVNVILSGHTHKVDKGDYGFLQVTSGSSTLGKDDEKPSFLVHTFTCDGGHVALKSTRWTFDGNGKRFRSGAIEIDAPLT